MITEVGRECSGPLEITARADFSRLPGDELIRVGAQINATDVAVKWGDSLDKRAGDPLTARLAGRSEVAAGGREAWLTAVIDAPGSTMEAQFGRDWPTSGAPQDAFEQATFDARIIDIDDLLKLSPALVGRLKEYAPDGSLRVQAAGMLANGRRSAELSVNATGAAFNVPGEHPLAKPVGMDATAALRCEMDPAGDDGGLAWKLTEGSARLGGLKLAQLTGQATLEPGQESDPAALLRAVMSGKGLPRVASANVSCRGTARCGEELECLHPLAAELRERFGLDGSFGWEMEAAGNAEAMRWHGRLEAKDLSWQVQTDNPAVPVVQKLAHIPAYVAVDLATSSGSHDGPASGPQRVDAHIDMGIDGNRMQAEGNFWTTGISGGSPAIQDADFLVDFSLDHVQVLPTLAPGPYLDAVSGAAKAELAIEKRGDQVHVPAGRVKLAKLAVSSGGSTLLGDGGVSWDGTSLRIPDLHWLWGESGGSFTGALDLRQDAPTGRLNVIVDSFDTQDIEKQLRAFTRTPAAPPVAEPAGPPPGTPQWVYKLAERLSHADIQVENEVRALKVILPPPPGIPVTATALTQQLNLKKGPISLAFSAAVDGGFVQGTVETRTGVSDAQLHLAYKADRIRPGPVVEAYLRRTFPGMTASGPLTLIDESHQKLLPGPGDENWPTGKGELIIDGGWVEGRAAPLWMTKIFPGLNLARFDFSYMHSWFTKDITGRIHHQMIYRGKYYNTYMNGYSDQNGFRYEVGIDFLADFNSKYWAESGQGRIPLFIKTGRVQIDGSIADEQVDFMPPQRIIDALLVRNNPVVTAYHAVRKRVLSKK